MSDRILHRELSYKITGVCFRVQNTLGRFCREIQYADKLESELRKSNIKYKREFKLDKLFTDSPEGNQVDFLIENNIVLDLKAKKFITKDDYIQMQRYLQSSGLELGLIVNFRSTYLKPKRVLNTRLYSDHSDA